MNKRHYWRIDCMVPLWEKDGYSLSVNTSHEYTEEEIIEEAVKAGALSEDALDDYYVQAEEITDDNYEMEHWEELSTNVD